MYSNLNCLHKDIETEKDDSAQDNESSNDEEHSQFGDKNKIVNNLGSILNIFQVCHTSGLGSIYPTLCLALKIACTLPVSNTSPERTFSRFCYQQRIFCCYKKLMMHMCYIFTGRTVSYKLYLYYK